MRRGRLENDVRIRAAEAEGIDADHARARSVRERLELGRHAQLQLLEINVRIGCRQNGGSAESGRA